VERDDDLVRLNESPNELSSVSPNHTIPLESFEGQESDVPEFLPFGTQNLQLSTNFIDVAQSLADEAVVPYGNWDDTPGHWSKLNRDQDYSTILNDNQGKGVFALGAAVTPESISSGAWLASPMKLLDNQLKLMLMDGNNIETSHTLYINRHSFANVAMGVGIGRVGVGTEPDTKFHVRGSSVTVNEPPATNTEIRVEASSEGMDSSIRLCGQKTISLQRCSSGFEWKYHGARDTLEPSYLVLRSTDLGITSEAITVRYDGNIGIGEFNDTADRVLMQHELTVNGSIDVSEKVIAKSIDVSKGITAGSVRVAGKIMAEEIVVMDNVGGADFVFNDDYVPMSLDKVERFVEENKHLPYFPSAEQSRQEGVSVGEYQTRLLQTVEELTLHVIAQNKRIEKLESKLEQRHHLTKR
jgi:hypothetical protein